MEYGNELQTFIKVWCIAILSGYYCYLIPARFAIGVPRLLSLLPVITVFFILPLQFSTIHLALSSFFFLTWFANFKLILFAFNRGPLSATPKLPSLVFISTNILPINPKSQSTKNASPPDAPSHKPILLAFKVVTLALILRVYQYPIPRYVVLALYFVHLYISLEIGFAIAAIMVKIFIGFDFKIDPQFNEPYLATSLQDFWGRRWNLMSSGILRVSVYNPVRAAKWTRNLGGVRGQMVGIFVTFVVSALMHELMYWYLLRVRPTWEVSWYFVLHGVCTAVEVAIKKAVNGRLRLHRAVSGPLTLAFTMVTGAWLLFAQPLREGEYARAINETSIVLKCIGLY